MIDKKDLFYWMPRVLSILFLLFLFAMSLDVINPELSAWQIAEGMLMHNIPMLVLLAVVIISWKYEIVGGIAFIAAGLLYILLTYHSGIPWYLIVGWGISVTGPAFLIGALFLISWLRRKQR